VILYSNLVTLNLFSIAGASFAFFNYDYGGWTLESLLAGTAALAVVFVAFDFNVFCTIY